MIRFHSPVSEIPRQHVVICSPKTAVQWEGSGHYEVISKVSGSIEREKRISIEFASKQQLCRQNQSVKTENKKIEFKMLAPVCFINITRLRV